MYPFFSADPRGAQDIIKSDYMCWKQKYSYRSSYYIPLFWVSKEKPMAQLGFVLDDCSLLMTRIIFILQTFQPYGKKIRIG